MQLISDLGPDRDLPVPNRRDERRGAVRVPDGAAAVRAGVAVEAEEVAGVVEPHLPLAVEEEAVAEVVVVVEHLQPL